MMEKVPGTSQVTVSRDEYSPEYLVEFDREKLASHGLNLSTASQFVRNRINGAVASYYREEGDEYYIKVRYAPEYRQTIEDIQNILIYNNQGQKSGYGMWLPLARPCNLPPLNAKTGSGL